MKRLLSLLLALTLSACTQEPVKVASKNFAESRILAEMFALLIEDAGIAVDRQIPLGDTDIVFEALRTGDIDVYPEYSGTVRSLLELPLATGPGTETETVSGTMREDLGELGITMLNSLGFETSYAIVVPAELAQDLDLVEVADLGTVAQDLRFAVAEGFAQRSRDGLQAMVDLFGFDFAAVEIVPDEARRSVYDMLLDDEADVVVGFATDAEIAEYGLETLSIPDAMSVPYEAVPLLSGAARSRDPGLADALLRLSGALDAETMRRLNGAVALQGRAPRAVAREALAELGLLPPPAQIVAGPYRIAVRPEDVDSPMANQVLRAARLSVDQRGVAFVEAPLPSDAIFTGTARVALSPSITQFRITDEGATRREDLEALAAVGSYMVHAVALSETGSGLSDAARIATGPVGSPSHDLALLITSQSDPAKAIIALEKSDALSVADALRSESADIGIVLAPAGRLDVAGALETGDLELVPADAWWTGAARLASPFLSKATLPASAYGTIPVSTLAMQAVLFGPAPTNVALGHQGPSAIGERPRPVTDSVIRAFNDNLGPHPDVGHSLRRAAALVPDIDQGQRTLNRSPGYTVLTLGIVLFLVWAGWLLIRPAGAGRRQ